MDISLAPRKIETNDSLDNGTISDKPVEWPVILTVLYVSPNGRLLISKFLDVVLHTYGLLNKIDTSTFFP